MKKRLIATVTVLALSLATLTGCGGNSKDNYIKDLEAIDTLADDMNSLSMDDPEDAIDELEGIVKDFSAKTTEGKTIKKDVEKMIDILNDMMDNQDDTDKLMDLMGDLTDLSDTFMDDLKDFQDAAKDAGVTEDDFDDFDF